MIGRTTPALIVLTVFYVLSSLHCVSSLLEVEKEINPNYAFCDRIGEVSIHIKLKDGQYRKLDRIPWDLLCEVYASSLNCTYRERDGEIVDIYPPFYKNLTLTDRGIYGEKSKLEPIFMRLVSFMTKLNHSDPEEDFVNHGCDGTMHPDYIPDDEKWLGLIGRGECKYQIKALNVAEQHRASGFILYNHNDPEANNSIMSSNDVENITYLMVKYSSGLYIQYLEEALRSMDPDSELPYTDHVFANVTYLHTIVNDDCLPANETPKAVTVVTITFVVVMVIALGWLVIYYFQRHRSVNQQAILQMKLQKAAKKALQRIGERIITDQSEIEDEDCTYCISPLVVNETIRQLPCGHKFHKGCVEDWLIEMRTCPNCHDNILLATNTTIKGVKDVAAAEDDVRATEMVDMSGAPESRQLLSDAQAIDGHSEHDAEYPQQQQWGSQYIPGSQLLTDGQNMFLFVPDNAELVSPVDTTIQIPADSAAISNHPTNQPQQLQQSQQQIIAAEKNDNLSLEQTI